MEDALVPLENIFKNFNENSSLNPCFNGRCTSTPVIRDGIPLSKPVLILVLMEDALVPFHYLSLYVVLTVSLNPCFNGRCTSTRKNITER